MIEVKCMLLMAMMYMRNMCLPRALPQPAGSPTEATGKIATDGLLEINTPFSLDALGNVLSRCETSIVEGIIGQLDTCQPKDTVRLLAECLGNPVVFNRSAAVQALSKQDSANAIPHLLRATRDPAKSLARMASRIILRRVERSSVILGQLSEATVEGVLDLMDDRWAMELLSPSYPTNIRVLAAYRLGKIGGDEASQSLASIAASDRTELADACWRALESCHSVSDFFLLPFFFSFQCFLFLFFFLLSSSFLKFFLLFFQSLLNFCFMFFSFFLLF